MRDFSLPFSGDKLRAVRVARGMERKDLAPAVGLKVGYLAHLENGVKPNPSAELVAKLATALGTSVEDLMTEPSAPVPQGKSGRPKKQPEPVELPLGRLVDIVGTIGAGPGCDEPLAGVREYYRGRRKGLVIGYRVVGRSMEGDFIAEGDVVFVQENPGPMDGEKVVAWVDGEGMLLKRYKDGAIYSGNGRNRWHHNLGPHDKVYGVFCGVHRDA